MQAITDYVLALCDLVEAESAAARRAAVRVAVALAVVGVALMLALCGMGFVVWAWHIWLQARLSPSQSALIVGVTTLIAAGGLAWLARRIAL